ncbi:MAG: hypothetical protein VKO64_07970 [Candidatus Sericytochromatia bacterium]|nr:hypothetical protein [Candidatus Sericytochromatia bacterium]
MSRGPDAGRVPQGLVFFLVLCLGACTVAVQAPVPVAGVPVPAPAPKLWPREIVARARLAAEAGEVLQWAAETGAGLVVWTPRSFPGADGQGQTLPGRRRAWMQRLNRPGTRSWRQAQAVTERRLGDRDTVNVIDLLPGGVPCARRVELRAISPSALFWVDVGPVEGDPCQTGPEPLPDDLLRAWVAEVDGSEQSVLARLSALFRPIPLAADVDGDPRVHVILSPAVGSFGRDRGLEGFFWPTDLAPDSEPRSNGREAIYLRLGALREDRAEATGVLVHELAHLLTFAGRRARRAAVWPTWWDEGVAMWAMGRTGHGVPEGRTSVLKDVAAVLADPSAWSLSDWAGNPRGGGYGLVYLYLEWLQERFGETLVREILEDPDTLEVALARGLLKRGTHPRDEFLMMGAALLLVGGQVRSNGWLEPPADLRNMTLFNGPDGPWFTALRATPVPVARLRPAVFHVMATLGGPAIWQAPLPVEAIRLDLGPAGGEDPSR